jgi:hypothetical protein
MQPIPSKFKNIQQDTANALANLATATASNRSTLSQLSDTNSALTTALAAANARLAMAQANISALKIKLASLHTTLSNNNMAADTIPSNDNVSDDTALPNNTIQSNHVFVHIQALVRRSWAAHEVDGWYVGPALEHYCCYQVYCTKTAKACIADTVEFFPANCSMPATSSADATTHAAKELTHYYTRHQQPPFCTLETNKWTP